MGPEQFLIARARGEESPALRGIFSHIKDRTFIEGLTGTDGVLAKLEGLAKAQEEKIKNEQLDQIPSMQEAVRAWLSARAGAVAPPAPGHAQATTPLPVPDRVEEVGAGDVVLRGDDPAMPPPVPPQPPQPSVPGAISPVGPYVITRRL